MEERETKPIKGAQPGRAVWEGTGSQGPSRLHILFPVAAELFSNVVRNPWLFQSAGVVAVWDGCHHAAGKAGGAAAVPTRETGQAEGNKTMVSGDGREEPSAIRVQSSLLFTAAAAGCSRLLRFFTLFYS